MIELKKLTRDYGRFRAVDKINLKIPKGELFCFLGPNGAGKTTTIKMLTGLLRPTSGTGLIGGIDIQKHPIQAKKMIGYIPDMPYLYDRLTTTEFFMFTGELYNVPKEIVEEQCIESFKKFGLANYRNSLVKELSHGLKQRLIYAATFLHDPEVLFVDEPLIGLDPKTIRMIKDMLKSKTEAGTTIFLTTHILALAQDIADRIGIINHGELIALGTFEELKENSSGKDLEEVFLELTEEVANKE